MTIYLELVDNALKEYISSLENIKLREAIEYALFSGGKRLRPLLLLAILDDLRIDIKKGVYAAAAIEMIHTYSLIHDDLPAMDDDNFRRGIPSLHKKYDEATAILAGDALLTDAFSLFSKSILPSDKILKIIELASFYSGAKGMVAGQILDIFTIEKKVDLSEIEQIYLKKTTGLFLVAVLSAAIIADVSEEVYKDLDKFTYYFGLAFQIKDDLDDILISVDAKSDLDSSKATYPIIVGTGVAKDILNDYKKQALLIIKNNLGEKNVYELVERSL